NNITTSLDRHNATDSLLLHTLAEMIGKFIGFFISFFPIGLYWTIHHRMFGFVINYNRRLLWLNLIFLMAIVLMPFSTGFYSEYAVKFLKVPVIIYTLNIIFIGIMNYVLWTYVANPKNQLAEGINITERKYFGYRAIIVPCVFFVMAVLYILLKKEYAIYAPLTIPLLMRVFKRFYFKKHNLN
ncbi:MAG: TMEM175 family protein, partial [Flavisolibacter sp.]